MDVRGVLPSALTMALRLRAAPVGGAGVETGQCVGSLQMVPSQTVEVGLSPRVEAAHRHIATDRPLGKGTAQHKGCGMREREERKRMKVGHKRRLTASKLTQNKSVTTEKYFLAHHKAF